MKTVFKIVYKKNKDSGWYKHYIYKRIFPFIYIRVDVDLYELDNYMN